MSDRPYIQPRISLAQGTAEFDAGKGKTNINVKSKFKDLKDPDVRVTHNFTRNLQGYAEDVEGEKKIGVKFKMRF